MGIRRLGKRKSKLPFLNIWFKGAYDSRQVDNQLTNLKIFPIKIHYLKKEAVASLGS